MGKYTASAKLSPSKKKKKLIARLAGSEASEGREGVIDETVISDMIWPMETLTRQSQVSCSYNVRRYPADCLT